MIKPQVHLQTHAMKRSRTGTSPNVSCQYQSHAANYFKQE